MRYCIHFHDEGQDLTHVYANITPSLKIGAITGVANSAKALASIYVGGAIDLHEIEVGKLFQFADPQDGFKVTRTKFEVASIEPIGKGAVAPSYPAKDGWIRGRLKILPHAKVSPSAALRFATGIMDKAAALEKFEIATYKRFKTVVHITFRRRPEEALMAAQP
jgi:hypothetical protein